MNHLKTSVTSIDRVLVVVDQDQVLFAEPTDLEDSELLQRALGLAQATGCELELFTAFYDTSLELSLFANVEDVTREKDRVTNSAATRLGEIALEMKHRGVKVSHEVRWDRPYADALLRKIAEANPDLVMKQSGGPNYVLGLADNTDWDLIRKSPSHVWFVKKGAPDIQTVLTAIGQTSGDEHVISESDYRAFEFGNMLANSIGARNIPVHTYEVPRLDSYTTYVPALADASLAANQVKGWDEIARVHGRAIQEFADNFDIVVEQIEIMKGHPATLIPVKAKSLNAGLVIMGARNLGRWERLLSPVAAEPILSSVDCDIVFVKDAEGLSTPIARQKPRRGVPSVNLEKAITEPDSTFESPGSVVDAEDLTVDLRRRILEAWELDVNRQLTAADEGGPVHDQDAPAATLMEINRAKESLARVEG